MRNHVGFVLSLILSRSTQGFQPCAPQKAVRSVTSTGIAYFNNNKYSTFQDSAANHLSNGVVLKSATSAPDSEEWTKSRIHNKSWFRSLAIMLVLGLVGGTQQSPLNQLPAKTGAVMHLLAFGTWFGTAVYTTFILGLTMFKNLPRQTFGKLQSKLFPKYFTLCSSMLLIQIFTFRSLSLEVTNKVVWSLGGALSATLFNQLYLEPYSTKIMFERYDLENTEGGQNTERYKVLKSTFGKMHGISSLSNLITICGGVAYAVILSSLLVV